MSRTLFKIFLTVALAFGLSTIAAAQMALDLDQAPGDQGKRETAVKPGEMQTIEVVALKGAKGIIGVEIELAFDPNEVIFKGFNPGGLMAGAMAMPPQKTKGGVKISAALLGKTSPEDSGTLGKILIELARELPAETVIKLVKGSYGSAKGTQEVPAQSAVKFLLQGAPQPPPGQKPAGPPGQSPMGPPGQQPPPGQKPAGPPGQSPMPGAPMQPPHMGPGQSPMPGAPMQPPHMGPGQSPMGPPGQQPPPGQKPAGPPGQPPMPGAPMQPPHMGPGQSPMGPPGQQPDPEAMINALPEALQPEFRQTLDKEHRAEAAHMKAELGLLKRVRKTLEAVKNYLPKAKENEKENIANALMFFGHRGPEGPPMGPGAPPMPPHMGPGPGGQPMAPTMGPPPPVEKLVREMIEDVDREIGRLTQDLQGMGN